MTPTIPNFLQPVTDAQRAVLDEFLTPRQWNLIAVLMDQSQFQGVTIDDAFAVRTRLRNYCTAPVFQARLAGVQLPGRDAVVPPGEPVEVPEEGEKGGKVTKINGADSVRAKRAASRRGARTAKGKKGSK